MMRLWLLLVDRYSWAVQVDQALRWRHKPVMFAVCPECAAVTGSDAQFVQHQGWHAQQRRAADQAMHDHVCEHHKGHGAAPDPESWARAAQDATTDDGASILRVPRCPEQLALRPDWQCELPAAGEGESYHTSHTTHIGTTQVWWNS